MMKFKLQKKNIVLRVVAPLCVAVLFGCKPEATAPPKKAEAPIAVKLVKTSKGDITRSVSLPAVLVANQHATLYSKVTGYVKKVSFDKGDQVKAGDVIAELEVPELTADAMRYRADAQIANLDFQRASDAQKKAPDLIPSQSIDTAKARAESAKANLERAETLLGYTKISAPFAGTVTRRFVDPGAFVPAATGSGPAANAAVVTLDDFNVVRVQVHVPENEVPLVRTGLPVKTSLDELPGKVFAGEITRSSQALEEATRTMLVEVDLKNDNGPLRPGMFATAKVGIEKHSNTTLAPVEAVMVEKSGSSVFVVENGTAKKIPVKTGFNDGLNVEIIDPASPPSEIIAVGKTALVNGQPVTVTQ
ncbi:MAG: Efflux transporter, family, subunit [Verrucomicrobiales bacterium]|nr:Efflux transporter, family, subunit [Verrucomicrobiales bacterium]